MESVVHMLVTCPYATEVWNLAPIASIIDPNCVSSTSSDLEQLRRVPSLPPVGLGQESIDLPKRTFTLVEPITKATKETREWTQTQDPPPKLQIVRPSINQDPNLDSD
ncbi:uncharacterized protein LOC130501403 [Raphanus sativus]|uniref:Uncharacterized protein LOC130501403 n=1 Tax=Raphanus sativus TaxID=3726 RepID=A0A9W3CLF9_RAPSA|nr:uncharacterized protein LOC130501403 [Raphanus sativus]